MIFRLYKIKKIRVEHQNLLLINIGNEISINITINLNIYENKNK